MEKVKMDIAGGGGLEEALHRILHDHRNSSVIAREKTDKAKKDALKSAVHVSKLLVDTVNSGVESSFVNEKHIELEIRALVNNIMCYSKQTNRWLAASQPLNSALKEIGDFENWMKVMEYDCRNINAALRNIHKT